MALTLVGCDETHLSRASLIVVCLFLFVPAICWSQPATDRALRQSAARGAKDGSSWFGLTVAWAQINLEGTGQWTSVVRSSLRMDLRRKSTSAEVTLGAVRSAGGGFARRAAARPPVPTRHRRAGAPPRRGHNKRGAPSWHARWRPRSRAWQRGRRSRRAPRRLTRCQRRPESPPALEEREPAVA